MVRKKPCLSSTTGQPLALHPPKNPLASEPEKGEQCSTTETWVPVPCQNVGSVFVPNRPVVPNLSPVGPDGLDLVIVNQFLGICWGLRHGICTKRAWAFGAGGGKKGGKTSGVNGFQSDCLGFGWIWFHFLILCPEFRR